MWFIFHLGGRDSNIPSKIYGTGCLVIPTLNHFNWRQQRNRQQARAFHCHIYPATPATEQQILPHGPFFLNKKKQAFHERIALVQMIICADSAKIICVKKYENFRINRVDPIHFAGGNGLRIINISLHQVLHLRGFRTWLQIEWWFTFAARTTRPACYCCCLEKITTNNRPRWQMNRNWWDFACIVAPKLHACRCNNHLSSGESILMHLWRARPRSKRLLSTLSTVTTDWTI